MYEINSLSRHGTVRLVTGPRLAPDPDPTPLKGKVSGARRRSAAADAAPKKAVLPARLSGSIGLQELRDLAGNTDYPSEKRLAFVIISLWLGQHSKSFIVRARIEAATHGTAICRGQKTSEQIAAQLFPKDPQNLLLRKTRLMMRVLESRQIASAVKQFATSHVSAKCALTAEDVAFAETYVVKLKAEKPTIDDFNGDADEWWPKFPSAQAAESSKT